MPWQWIILNISFSTNMSMIMCISSYSDVRWNHPTTLQYRHDWLTAMKACSVVGGQAVMAQDQNNGATRWDGR